LETHVEGGLQVGRTTAGYAALNFLAEGPTGVSRRSLHFPTGCFKKKKEQPRNLDETELIVSLQGVSTSYSRLAEAKKKGGGLKCVSGRVLKSQGVRKTQFEELLKPKGEHAEGKIWVLLDGSQVFRMSMKEKGVLKGKGT